MTNFDIYDKLVNMAKISYRDLANSYENKEWNAVIRRSQETVELYLNAILKLICMEYPKSHDVGMIFSQALKQKVIYIEHSVLAKIENISKNLAEKRGPAFYMEKDYTEQDAKQAKLDAEFVINFAELLSIKLKQGN